MALYARNRRGFTFAEMAVVMVIAAIMMKLTLPKIASMRDRNNLRVAKQQISAYLASARAAAIRQSQPAQFYVVNNTIWSTVTLPNGTRSGVTGSVMLDKAREVVVKIGAAVANDSIIFDPRGFATLPAVTRTYVLTRSTLTDSICVSKLGLIARRCGQ
jgi:prepilin-type N-terminal cleavage/methylation domain-containing protein